MCYRTELVNGQNSVCSERIALRQNYLDIPYVVANTVVIDGDHYHRRGDHYSGGIMSSYAATGGSGGVGGQTAVPANGPVLNTPDVINSIMDIMNPFERHYSSGSPASEDSSGSTCSAVSPPRMQNICTSLLIKEELKMAIRSKQRNAVVAATATTASAGNCCSSVSVTANVGSTASAGSTASSPGCGQAKRRRTDEESHGDDDDEDDVSSHGEGVSRRINI